MSYIQAIVLGVLQGIAEFLPVSSSGHLLVARNLMSLGEIPQLFDIILHIATLIVVIFVFRERIIILFRTFFRWLVRKSDESDRANLKTIVLILTATFFTASIGIGIDRLDFFQNPKIASIFFIVTAFILWFTRYAKSEKTYGDVGLKEGVLLGIAQGLGVIPGISRSGITISAGLLAGLDREKAGEISFIISIPAIVGALLLKLKDGVQLFSEISPLPVIIAFLTTMIVGYFSLILRWLIEYNFDKSYKILN